MAALPTPLVSLASHQLAGRGRGSNVWLSPAGCLQFSLLLRVPLASFPSHKLVFVQYLFALAVVEACRSEKVLGRLGEQVRLKWPNDIYAIFPTDLGEEKRKIGGILINMSFSSGNADIVIGRFDYFYSHSELIMDRRRLGAERVEPSSHRLSISIEYQRQRFSDNGEDSRCHTDEIRRPMGDIPRSQRFLRAIHGLVHRPLATLVRASFVRSKRHLTSMTGIK